MSDLIARARQAGATGEYLNHCFGKNELQAFADLIRQDEREACAQVCDSMLDWADHYVCAVAIRARTTT